MKQKTIARIFLILIITLVAMFIKTKSCFATNYTWNENNADNIIGYLQNTGNTLELYRSDLMTSKYIFCREKGTVFVDGAKYSLEGKQEYLSSDSDNAIKAYILAHANSEIKSNNSYNAVQWGYWKALGQVDFDENNIDAINLYKQAESYREYVKSLNKFKQDYSLDTYYPIIKEQEEIINDSIISNMEIVTEQFSPTEQERNYSKIGPITIQYASSWLKPYGFGTIKLTFKKDNGEELMLTDLDYTDNGIREVADIFFEYDGKDANDKIIKYRKKASVDEKGVIYTDTSLISTVYGLCIYIDRDKITSNLNLTVNADLIEAKATVYNIKAGSQYYTETLYCMECQCKNDSNNGHYVSGIYYVFASNSNEIPQKYKCIVCGETWGGSATAVQRARNYRCKSCNTYFKKIEYFNSHKQAPQCREATYETVEGANYEVYYMKENPSKGCRASLENGKCCGDEFSGHINPQKLILVKGDIVTTSVSSKVKIPLLPQIEIDLNKYNSFGANPAESLDGAKFTVTAIQNEIPLLGDADGVAVGTDDNILITPKSSEPVYVTITETKAPAGYRKVIEPIKITYSINESGNAWMATYAPEGSGWNWDRNNDDNDPALPNIYVSTQGDRIKVNQESSVGKTSVEIDVYNEAVIEKLELLKVDADNSNTLLAGAKFTVKLENVKSYKLTPNDNSIPVDEIAIIVDLEISNGRIEIYDVVFRNENAPIVITLTETKVPDTTLEDGYYYKKLSGTITITLNHGETELTGGVDYSTNVNPENINNANLNIQGFTATITVPNIRLIDICGYVWEDGQIGLKPAREADGIFNDRNEDSTLKVISDVVVRFSSDDTNNNYQYDAKGNRHNITATKTNNAGFYEFRGLRYNKKYEIKFEYDGIHYEDTIYKKDNSNIVSMAQESGAERKNFNEKFKTINKGETANRVSLEYEQEPVDATQLAKGYKSTLITKINQELKGFNEKGEEYIDSEDLGCWLLNNGFGQSDKAGTVMNKYKMTAYAGLREYISTTEINLGLVKRGTDLGLSTDVADAKVTINGQETTYLYNQDTRTIENDPINIPHPEYNLNLYTSDYNYRIRDYVTGGEFTNAQNKNTNSELDTGSELEVYVTYRLDLNNYSTKDANINSVKYVYDSNYKFVNYETENNDELNLKNDDDDDNTLIINNIQIPAGNTKTLYLVFKVNKDENRNVTLGTFQNYAEITSYSTKEGLIDKDSEPGNYEPQNYAEITSYSTDEGLIDKDSAPDNYAGSKPEDDTDVAGTIAIQLPEENIKRKISGYVQDQSNNADINDVIVQLIEIKEFNDKYYEYIWQEMKSGDTSVNKMGLRDGKVGNYKFKEDNEKEDGYYEFTDFIPGNYIVRFIYGDGTSYDLTDNVVKYNGQDYKSVADTNYNAEWYNTYADNKNTSSKARDNEARRLETMAYSVEVDAKKGILLKLLDNLQADKFNEIEKGLIKEVYNEIYDSDITEVTDEVIDKLLKEQTLVNTWMCAETSKIHVAPDTNDLSQTGANQVNGISGNYQNEFTNVNFKLEQRPATAIKLEKNITGIKLTASNGQTLANASLNGDTIDGIRDGIEPIGNTLQYEVSPTEMNTILDGAKLEFVYDLVVTNGGEEDYLSSRLNTEYEKGLTSYKKYLTTEYLKVKNAIQNAKQTDIQDDPYYIGKYLGKNYYIGNNANDANDANDAKVETTVTSIRDYINNDLSFVSATGGTKLTDKYNTEKPLIHYIRNDVNYALNGTKINKVIENTSSIKLKPNDSQNIYSVTLAKNPISASGDLEFTTYIAEVMSYTNAAGRRAMTHSPGNAGFVSRSIVDNRETPPIEHLHEIDEAETETVIKVTAETGNNKKEVYTWIVSIIAGLAIIAGGTFATKKYIIKK